MIDTLERAWDILREDGPVRLIHGFLGMMSNKRLLKRAMLRIQSDTYHIRGIELDLRGTYIGDEMLLAISDGIYEKEEAEAIDTYLRPNLDTIELGGCIGFTACYTNQRLDPTTKHIIVEPNDDLIPLLKKNKKLNDCDYIISHDAYSSRNETVTVTFPHNSWSGSMHRQGGNTKEVNTVDLKGLNDEFDLSRINLIVDIEGAEADLITNEIHILENCCEVLIIEFHEDRKDLNNNTEISTAREILQQSQFEEVNEVSDVAVYLNRDYIVE